MKHSSNALLSFISILLFIFCFNGTLVDSSPDEKKHPAINFSGKLTDYSSKDVPVEHILIGSKYKDITIYPIPPKAKQGEPTIDPSKNQIKIDLADIARISCIHTEHPTANEIEINNRKYVQINIEFTSGTQKEYIIESSRTLQCEEVEVTHDTKHYKKRTLNMIHIKELVISGYTTHTNESVHATQKSNQTNDNSALTKNTVELLDKIEHNVKNLPEHNPTLLEQAKQTILGLLKALRAQIQAILDSLT
jgi:hypothetical protein